MVSGIEDNEEFEDMSANLASFLECVSTLIFDEVDSISPFYIESGVMEEGGIGIYISKPSDFGFNFPKNLFILKKAIIST